jgi:hypothetical protein
VLAAAVTVLVASAPVRAQSWEVSGLAAYTPSAGLDNQALELSSLDISGGFTWGLQVGRLVTPQWGVEVLWTEQGVRRASTSSSL